VYRPSDVGTCSWFVNPSEDTYDSAQRGVDPLRAVVHVDAFSLGFGDGLIVFDGLGPVEAATALAVFVNESAVDPDAPAGARSAATMRDVRTVGDLPMRVRAAIEAAAGTAVAALSGPRALTSAGRFTLADGVQVVTSPASVPASGSSGDVRVVLAVADTGGGWGFRASHESVVAPGSELQLVLQVLGGTVAVFVVLIVLYQVVGRCDRRRRLRLLGPDGAAADGEGDEDEEEEGEEEPPRVAMSQALIDAFPVFVFEKSKLYNTPLKRRDRAVPSSSTPAPAPKPEATKPAAKTSGASSKPAAPAGKPPRIRAPATPKLQSRPQPAAEEELTCPVCICEFEEGEQVRVLSCNHSFHCQCIDVWMAEQGTCPMCRSDTLEMAVMLMSMGDAGVASPIRFGGDVRMVKAADVPRVPLLERLAAQGVVWGGRRAEDDEDEEFDEEASDEEGEGEDEDVPDLADDGEALVGASAGASQAAPVASVMNPMLRASAGPSGAARPSDPGRSLVTEAGTRRAAGSTRGLLAPRRVDGGAAELAPASAGGGGSQATAFVNPMHALRGAAV